MDAPLQYPLSFMDFRRDWNPRNGAELPSFEAPWQGCGDLQLDDASFQGDRRGVGSVLGAQLGKNASDPALDRLLGGGELIRNFLVGVPCSYQPQHVDFRRCQTI